MTEQLLTEVYADHTRKLLCPPETEAVCRYCLQIMTTEMIKI